MPLSDEVLHVLREIRRPAELDEITRRMTGTRHASRVHRALHELEGRGRVVFNRDGRWHLAARPIRACQP